MKYFIKIEIWTNAVELISTVVTQSASLPWKLESNASKSNYNKNIYRIMSWYYIEYIGCVSEPWSIMDPDLDSHFVFLLTKASLQIIRLVYVLLRYIFLGNIIFLLTSRVYYSLSKYYYVCDVNTDGFDLSWTFFRVIGYTIKVLLNRTLYDVICWSLYTYGILLMT